MQTRESERSRVGRDAKEDKMEIARVDDWAKAAAKMRYRI